MSSGETFLPRLHSVFYAIFDVKTGPKIVFQVPEGLIAPAAPATSLSVTSSPKPSIATLAEGEDPKLSPGGQRPSSLRHLPSPQHRASSSSRTLFNFSDVSKYVIPPNPLCGRLVVCATGNYRIIGLPVSLSGKYERNFFRFNICFVFERLANLSCYEPIVRKVSRVLAACEEESMFLSSSQTSLAMYTIIEQLYEDLNSYSETSILIDDFNSTELKILPFYPNPPSVRDWHVPLALINLSKRIEDNWDLTMRKVCLYINGVNHVSRIAQLADCDLELTRQAISHLLYYQVVMTTDIFQYSNMYTLRKNVQWLADEPHVKDECGPYVAKPGSLSTVISRRSSKRGLGKPVPDWPKLLHLYSRLKPGRTIFEWMESHEVHELGIDVRRFTSFGVIKGFLRRVHRYPVLIPESPSQANRRRRQSISSSPIQLATHHTSFPADVPESSSRFRGRLPDVSVTIPVNTEAFLSSPTREADYTRGALRRISAAEKVLEQLRFKTLHRGGGSNADEVGSTRELYVGRPRIDSDSRRQSMYQQSEVSGREGRSLHGHSIGSMSTGRPRLSRSPSAPMVPQIHTSFSQGSGQLLNMPAPPPELVTLLDGEHHTDELSTRFEAGWPLLQRWLAMVGGGRGDGDLGRVSIIYR
ncbi:nitrogen permease regulator 2-domain-containing protein [Chiua virens]|nr:nitrogen permease regulator 2-domain-containing protein [Chiua virens]